MHAMTVHGARLNRLITCENFLLSTLERQAGGWVMVDDTVAVSSISTDPNFARTGKKQGGRPALLLWYFIHCMVCSSYLPGL